MSLNKFTSPEIGANLKLNIGCETLTATGLLTCGSLSTAGLTISGDINVNSLTATAGVIGGFLSTAGVISGASLTTTGIASVSGLVSTGAISGTAITGTTLNTTGIASVSGLVSTGAISGTAITGTTLTATGAANVNSLVSTGAISGTAISGTTLTATGAANVNSLASTGAITGTAISGTTLTATGAANVNSLTSGVITGSAIYGDSISLLFQPSIKLLKKTTTQSITIGGSNLLTWTHLDPQFSDDGFDPFAAGMTYIQPTTAGKYLVGYEMNFSNVAAGYRIGFLCYSGTNTLTRRFAHLYTHQAVAGITSMTSSEVLYFNGTTDKIYCYAETGVNCTMPSSTSDIYEMVFYAHKLA
jgi:hypothetical protein